MPAPLWSCDSNLVAVSPTCAPSPSHSVVSLDGHLSTPHPLPDPYGTYASSCAQPLLHTLIPILTHTVLLLQSPLVFPTHSTPLLYVLWFSTDLHLSPCSLPYPEAVVTCLRAWNLQLLQLLYWLTILGSPQKLPCLMTVAFKQCNYVLWPYCLVKGILVPIAIVKLRNIR